MKIEFERLNEAIAYNQGEWDFEDMIQMLESGQMLFWKIPDCETLAVTEFVKYPKKTRLRVVLLVGEFNETVVEFYDKLVEKMGLDGIEVIGRKGWVRALKPYGYKEASTVLVKDFGDDDE